MVSKRSKVKKKKYNLELGGFAVFFWSFALLFLLSWVFALGILIGRGVLDDKIEDAFKKDSPLAGLYKKDETGRQPTSGGPERTPREEEPEFAFYERLPEKDNGTGENLTTGRSEKTNMDADGNSKEELLPVITTEETSDKKPPAPGPQIKSAKPRKENGWRFTVQLASTKDRNRALNMVEQFGSLGYPAFFYKVDIRDKTYYRVSCGRFDARDEAEKFQGLLSRKENIDGIVMQRRDGQGPPVTRKQNTTASGKIDKSQDKRENRFTIQIASLADRNDAGTMVKRLKDKGYTVYYYKAHVRGKTYFRVRCGRFKTREEAEQFKARLDSRENIRGFVTNIE